MSDGPPARIVVHSGSIENNQLFIYRGKSCQKHKLQIWKEESCLSQNLSALQKSHDTSMKAKVKVYSAIVVHCLLSQGKKSQGGQKLCYKDTLKQHMKRLDFLQTKPYRRLKKASLTVTATEIPTYT